MHQCRSIAVASLAGATIACCAIVAGASTLASYDLPPVAGAWSLAPGEYYADLTGASFQTTGGFDGSGDRAALGGSVEQRSYRAWVELGWKPHVSLQFGLPLVSVTQRDAAGTVESQTGLEDFSVGLRWRLIDGPSAAALQLRWEAPAGYDRRLPPGLGDGLQKLSATAQFGGALGHRAFWQLGAGYRFQYKALTDISDEVARNPTRWKWPEHMIANGSLAGWIGHVQVAGLFATDLSSFLPETSANRMASTAIGSRLTYRMDDRLDLFAGSWHTVSGKNSLDLNEYYAGIAWKSTKLNRLQGFLGGNARP